jgi:hypothetical protein
MPVFDGDRREYLSEAASRPKLTVHKSREEIAVNLGVVGEGEVGYLLLGAADSYWVSECDKPIRDLQVKVFGADEDDPDGAVRVWRVVDAHLNAEYRRKGWGLKMYEAAFKKVRPGIVITGDCTGMGTTKDALRVWRSLTKKYTSSGKGTHQALAVK